MKRIALEQLPKEIADLVVSSQSERVVITRDGQPYALVVGVENKDEEDLQYEFSPDFWRMIEKSRHGKVGVPLKDVLAKLEAEEERDQNQPTKTAVQP